MLYSAEKDVGQRRLRDQELKAREGRQVEADDHCAHKGGQEPRARHLLPLQEAERAVRAREEAFPCRKASRAIGIADRDICVADAVAVRPCIQRNRPLFVNAKPVQLPMSATKQ